MARNSIIYKTFIAVLQVYAVSHVFMDGRLSFNQCNNHKSRQILHALLSDLVLAAPDPECREGGTCKVRGRWNARTHICMYVCIYVFTHTYVLLLLMVNDMDGLFSHMGRWWWVARFARAA